jgi:hypothetical protein
VNREPESAVHVNLLLLVDGTGRRTCKFDFEGFAGLAGQFTELAVKKLTACLPKSTFYIEADRQVHLHYTTPFVQHVSF